MPVDHPPATIPPRKIVAQDYLPYLLSTINKTLNWGASRLYLDLFGLGLNEWRVLSAVFNTPGIFAYQVADRVALNKAVVSRSVRVLEDAGLLRTEVTAQRRQFHLHLTAAGDAMHNTMIGIALARENALVCDFSPDERQQLLQLLGRLLNNLDAVADADTRIRAAHGNTYPTDTPQHPPAT